MYYWPLKPCYLAALKSIATLHLNHFGAVAIDTSDTVIVNLYFAVDEIATWRHTTL